MSYQMDKWIHASRVTRTFAKTRVTQMCGMFSSGCAQNDPNVPGLKQFHCPGPRWSRSDVLEASDRDPGGTDRRKRHGTAEFTAILRGTRQGDRGIVMQREDEQLRFTIPNLRTIVRLLRTSYQPASR